MSSRREVEVADTLPPDDAVGPGAPVAGAPVASWDRYELLDLLGKGGMGSVYRARDRRLGRIIAIKFILGADPNLAMRFLREARTQAGIDHPNVCRVYEVGEVEGRAYIALQLVDGEPLHQAAAHMSIDERVAALRDVALAIHEAHRHGVVHRDLKPGNVLVERTEEGRWFPVVMDFGLARETTVEIGITESGVPLGTPAFMSPEQARGDVRAVDHRSDVYSLGATLYAVLTGRPPFASSSLAEALALVIHEAPPTPRTLVPALSEDLETIVLKCLAKDPRQRYPSARALADDLRCYLEGEPILGRRLPRWQRWRAWLRGRRRRSMMIVAGCALVLELALVSVGVRAWLVSRSDRALAAERTRLAEQLGQDAKEIELSLRTAYQMPLHDIRSDRDRVRARMRTIAGTRHELGALGDAVIHDALGRGYLALHDWREAADELARAATGGLQRPELHGARARALAALYHRDREAARRAGDRAWLARRERELAQQYLAPALVELEQSRGATEGADLLDALIAFYRHNFGEAEQRATEVAERTPWQFEARKLAADAAYGAAIEAFDRGDYDAARAGLERAAARYADASEVARSDASVYQAAAETWLQRAELELRQGRSAREALDHALEVTDRALRADPDDGPTYTTKAYVLLRWYRTPALRGARDLRPLLDRVEQAASRAVEIDPRCVGAWDALGNTHVYRGRYEADHNGSGEPWLHRALDEFDKALAIEPNDPWANNDLGIAHRWLGTLLFKAGRDPLSEYREAMAAYERAVALDPSYLYACANQVEMHVSIAEYDLGSATDPRAAVDSAETAARQCLAIDPNYYLLADNLARAQVTLARYLVETGGDPAEALANARGHLASAERIHPGDDMTWFYRLAAAGVEARLQLRERMDPTASIATAREALQEVLRQAPDCAECYLEAARLDLVEVGWASGSGSGVASRATAALKDAEKAIVLDPQLAEAKLAAAEACLQLATTRRSRAVADRGMSYVDQALALNARLLGAQAIRAALSRLRPS